MKSSMHRACRATVEAMLRRRTRHSIARATVGGLFIGGMASMAVGVPATPVQAGIVEGLTRAVAAARADDIYAVSELQIEYEKDLPFLDRLEGPTGLAASLMQVNVPLTLDGGVYRADENASGTPLAELRGMEGQPIMLDRSATMAIANSIEDFLNREDQRPSWFHVDVSPDDIDPATGNDLRDDPGGALAFRLVYDGGFFPVSNITLRNLMDRPGNPDPGEILRTTESGFVMTDEGYVTARAGRMPESIILGDMMDSTEVMHFSAGAIQQMMEDIRDSITARGFMAVQVRLAPGELVPDGTRGRLADGRDAGDTTLDLTIMISAVHEIRTMAQGDRIPEADRINHPVHQRILDDSPVEPMSDTLLQRDVLDDYIFRKSRHPGRRVDAAVVPSGELNKVALDYLVTENKPFRLYAQASNTGTRQTEEWRYRFGLFHNQLTNNDDILMVEYVTPGFDETNAIIASYDAPVGGSERWRWKVYGNWSEFQASEVGFADEDYRGESFVIGAEMSWNFYQDRNEFVDFIFGARYEDIRVDNAFLFIEGEEQFLIPYIGLRYEKSSQTQRTDAIALLEWNWGDATGTDIDQMIRLGRLAPDDDWLLLRWDAAHSFYLEPLVDPDGWNDPSSPNSSLLAHEVALRFRGQHSFGDRLIPNQEAVAGGLYSVRGYPESVAVGDNAYIATIEYRLHLPRAFGIGEPVDFMGEAFRIVPQSAYGQADWDLIFRTFLDAGHTSIHDDFSFERSQTLVGAGIGLQLLYKNNVDIRVDWGFALDEIEDQVTEGSSQVHFVATFLY